MRSVLTLAACASAINASVTLAQPQLALNTTYQLPAGAFDVLPDGRLLAVTASGDIQIQDAPNASTYSTVNTIDAPNSSGFGASFLSLSPDATSVALGNNEFGASNAVLVFNAADFMGLTGNPLPTAPLQTITTPNFSADWADSNTLFVSGADSSTFATVVNKLDITAGTSETVISPAGAFSGGVHANTGTLFVGAGDSGDVRAFDVASLASPAVDFSAGQFVTSSTSAGSIDTLDNLLLIAGGVFNGEGNATIIDEDTGLSVALTPAGTNAFYGGFFNAATNQVVATANGTAYVYDIIPAPASIALAPIAILATRRRRA